MILPKKYAVVIKESNNFFLMFDISKGTKGDIYVNFHETEKGLMETKKHLHYSKHKSGQLHGKSYGRCVSLLKRTQPLNTEFKGSEVIITTSIRKGDGRAWGVPYQKSVYSEVMIIDDNLILSKLGYQLNVEIVEKNTTPWISTYPYARIIKQKIFKKENPYIVATLYDMSNKKLK